MTLFILQIEPDGSDDDEVKAAYVAKKKNIFMFITFLIWNGYCALPRHEEQITIKSSIISFSEFGYVLL